MEIFCVFRSKSISHSAFAILAAFSSLSFFFQADISLAAATAPINEIRILDLETAQAMALEQNPSIESATQRVQIGRAHV